MVEGRKIMPMRRNYGRVFAFAIVVLAGAMMVLGDESHHLRTIVLANAGAVESPLIQQIQAFVQNELDISIRTQEIHKVSVKMLHDGGESYAKHMGTNDAGMVVLVAPEADIPMHMALLSGVKVAVVNTKAVFSKDKVTYVQRLQRQVMRSIAFMIGLPQSPDPRDVTYNYTSIEELDKIGRNLGAPARECFDAAARSAGLQSPETAPPGTAK
jgi:hypothetical protein